MPLKTLIKLELDGLPPTVNHMYLNARGRRFRTEECQTYQLLTTLKLQRLWNDKPPFEGRAALHVVLTVANRRRWDIDNRLKALQDCLQLAGVIKDDRQIDYLSIKRLYTAKNGTVLTLSSMDDKI